MSWRLAPDRLIELTRCVRRGGGVLRSNAVSLNSCHKRKQSKSYLHCFSILLSFLLLARTNFGLILSPLCGLATGVNLAVGQNGLTEVGLP